MFWLAQEHWQWVAFWKIGRPLEEEGEGTCSVYLWLPFPDTDGR